MHYRKLKKGEGDKLNEWLTQNFLKKTILEKTNVYYKKLKQDCFKKLQQYPKWEPVQESTDKPSLKSRILSALSKGYTLNFAFRSTYCYATDKIKNSKISKDSWMVGTEKKRILYTEMFTTGGNSYMQLCSYIPNKITNH